jgi:type II secretory pathway pseudopilin PulG
MHRYSARQPAALLRAVRKRLAAEEGVSLVEVMVSAILVVLVAIGVLGGIDSASGVSGRERARALAAHLAQQDQERLRTYNATQLNNLLQTNSKTVSNIPFTIDSKAEWVNDTTGTTSCTSGTPSTDYLKITSTVTWKGDDQDHPVRASSIMAPPNGAFDPSQGSIAVQVSDHANQPVQGMSVDLTGPPSYSRSTNELGCAFFGFLSSGSPYTAKLDSGGWVDPDGNQAVQKQVSVVPQSISAVTILYDRAASLVASFDTKNSAGNVVPVSYDKLILSNTGLTGGQKLIQPSPAQQTVTVNSLFPFTSQYGVYAGTCSNANPGTQNVALTPGGSGSVTVRLPTLTTKVVKGGSEGTPGNTPVAGATVSLKAVGAGCTSGTMTTDVNGVASAPFPYGTYNVCVNDTNGKFRAPTNAQSTPVNSNNANGINFGVGTAPNKKIDISAEANGTCP